MAAERGQGKRSSPGDLPKGRASGAVVSAPSASGKERGAIPARHVGSAGKSSRPSPIRPAESKLVRQVKARTAEDGMATSLNWRRVSEPGGKEQYQAPRFRGAAREYVPGQGEERKERGGARSGMHRLKEQSPSRRRERSKQNRRQNLEKLRRANFRSSFRVVTKKKRTGRFYLVMGCVSLALYLLLMGCFAAFFAANLFRKTLREQGSVRYVIGTEGVEGYAKGEMRYGTLFRDGQMMLNMDQIADLCELTVTGDATRMRFYSRGDLGHDVVLYPGSASAVINGTPVTLAAKTVMEEDVVYVSADLIERFASGITVEWDEEKSRLTISRIIQSTSVLKGDVYAELTYALVQDGGEERIDLSSLPLELRMRIEADFELATRPKDPPESPTDGEEPIAPAP